jgi:hypothetical protein
VRGTLVVPSFVDAPAEICTEARVVAAKYEKAIRDGAEGSELVVKVDMVVEAGDGPEAADVVRESTFWLCPYPTVDETCIVEIIE